jgi:hypothetical protein
VPALVIVHGPVYGVSTAPAGTPVLPGPGKHPPHGSDPPGTFGLETGQPAEPVGLGVDVGPDVGAVGPGAGAVVGPDVGVGEPGALGDELGAGGPGLGVPGLPTVNVCLGPTLIQ